MWTSITFTALACAAALAAADPGADKPNAAAKARELLANAYDAVSTVQPDVQVAALYHLADNYQAVDKKKAHAICNQAFAAAAQLPDGQYVHRPSFQTSIVRLMAQIDTAGAIALLKQMPAPSRGYDTRERAIHGIAQRMIADRNYEGLLALLEEMGSAGVYGFSSATALVRALPSDHLKLRAFSSALAAYRLKASSAFIGTLLECWREIPPLLAADAAGAIIRQVLDEKYAEEIQTITYASSKGIVTFDSQREADLFSIMHVIRAVEPKRAAELLEKFPSVRTAVESYPGGRSDMMAAGDFWTFTTSGKRDDNDQRFNNQWRMRALAQSQAMTALAALKEDPEKALQLAGAITDAFKQVEVLTAIVRAVAERDAARGKLVLEKAADVLANVKDLNDRSVVLDAFIDAATHLKEEQFADRMLSRAIAEAERLRKRESIVADVPNPIMRENWPSTQAYRRIIMRMTKIRGVDAETLLANVTDNDLNLLLRIEMAQALLVRPQERLSVYPPRMRRH